MPTVDVDRIADTLIDTAARARSMPPSFLGCGDRVPVYGPKGEWVGFALPGEGLYVDLDLDRVGITKPLPNVVQRSTAQRYLDRVESAIAHEGRWFQRLIDDRRGAISTYNGVLASRAMGKDNDIIFTKNSFTTSALAWASTFRGAGFPIGGSFTSNPGSTFNNASVGALSNGLTNPTGGDIKYLLSVGWTSATQVNFAMLIDQLMVVGGLNANSSSTQTISGAPALTRYTNGNSVLMYVEVTTALGATPSNITVSYTNQAGTSGQTSVATALSGSSIAQNVQPTAQMPVIPLSGTDFGIQTVASVTLSAAMGSGAFGLVLYRCLAMVPGVAASVFVERDLSQGIDGILQLPTEAGGALGCFVLLIFASTTNSGNMGSFIKTCAG